MVMIRLDGASDVLVSEEAGLVMVRSGPDALPLSPGQSLVQSGKWTFYDFGGKQTTLDSPDLALGKTLGAVPFRFQAQGWMGLAMFNYQACETALLDDGPVLNVQDEEHPFPVAIAFACPGFSLGVTDEELWRATTCAGCRRFRAPKDRFCPQC